MNYSSNINYARCVLCFAQNIPDLLIPEMTKDGRGFTLFQVENAGLLLKLLTKKISHPDPLGVFAIHM